MEKQDQQKSQDTMTTNADEIISWLNSQTLTESVHTIAGNTSGQEATLIGGCCGYCTTCGSCCGSAQ